MPAVHPLLCFRCLSPVWSAVGNEPAAERKELTEPEADAQAEKGRRAAACAASSTARLLFLILLGGLLLHQPDLVGLIPDPGKDPDAIRCDQMRAM